MGYAIKASYLGNLVESSVSSSILPTNNTISRQPLTGKVKAVKNFVFMIECSSSGNENGYSSLDIQSSSSSYSASNSDGKIVRNPRVSECSKGLIVTQVELRNYETIISVKVEGYEWVNIDKGKTYVNVAGKAYDLNNAQGINYAPEKTYTQNGEL